MDGLRGTMLSKMRNNLQKLLEELIEKDDKKLHLIKAPTGIGKSTILGEEVETTWRSVFTFMPFHYVIDEFEKHYGIHVKGRKRFPDCPRKKDFALLESKGVYDQEILCKGCPIYCEYREQEVLIKTARSAIGPSQYINTKTSALLSNWEKDKVFVLDEYPALFRNDKITSAEIRNVEMILDSDIEFKRRCKPLLKIISSKEPYYGKSFVDAYGIKTRTPLWESWKKDVDSYNRSVALEDTVRNIVPTMERIEKKCLKYKKKTNDFAFSVSKPTIYVRKEKRAFPVKEIRYTYKSLRKPPDFTWIILSATGDKAFLERYFGSKIEIHTISGKTSWRPLQIMDGLYPRKSLSHPLVRDKIKKYLRGDGLITFKEYVEELAKGRSIKTGYYGNLRGTNQFKGCKVLDMVGSAEPPPEEIRLMTESLYEGGTPVSTKRRESEYIDWRQQEVVSHLREDEIIQAIGRIRWILDDSVEVRLFCNLPLPIPTKQIRMKALKESMKPEDVFLRRLLTNHGHSWVSYREFREIRMVYPFNGDRKKVTRTKNKLVREKKVEEKCGKIRLL